MDSRIRNAKGFTLLELLMVLMVMGFFIAMIMPRLGGMMGTAIDNTCDTNNKGMRYWVNSFQKEHNDRFPSKLINIISDTDAGTTGTATEGLPVCDNNDPDDGAEVLCWEFVNRNKPYVHYLNGAEATELRQMGIGQLAFLNDYTQDTGAHTADGTPMMINQVAAGHPVMMVGAGVDAAAAWQIGFATNLNFSTYAPVYSTETTAGYATAPAYDNGHGNPYWMYRMVFGLGPDSSLVTGGYVQNAAGCPGGLQNSENVTYNYYCLIAPRLQSTVDRLTLTTDTGLIAVQGDDSGQYQEIFWNLAYDDEAAAAAAFLPASTSVDGANAQWNIAGTWDVNTPNVFAGNGNAVQEAWEFDFTCPEGHKWPDNEDEMWDVGGDV